MLKVIPVKCANCGSNLEITPEMGTFACGYCGASQVVERRGGTVSLRLITDAIKNVQVGTDKTAAELALKRLDVELQSVEQSFDSNNYQKSKAVETNLKMFGILWVVFLLVCVFVGSVGGFAYYFAFFLGFCGTVGIVYLGIK